MPARRMTPSSELARRKLLLSRKKKNRLITSPVPLQERSATMRERVMHQYKKAQ